jgi:DNA-directed RNA polymerase specialized sigma24 family protein
MHNSVLELATDFVKNTAAPIFLSGKAGTGKTTFLKTVLPTCGKKYIVVAPTGVAAINAGGVTIHSMFGLPTKTFIPENDAVDPNLANNPFMLSAHFKYPRAKREVLRELELLVIDEVSMVRMDIMDAIDLALRSVRRNPEPFGGVQPLFIGDLFQLAPVVKDDEGRLLSKYYEGKYFFDSRVYKQMKTVHIELETIYRQQDKNFVGILNNIRQATFDRDDYDALMQHYQPNFVPDEPGFVTLTTHNAKADEMNEKELARLPGELEFLNSTVKNEFPENMYPTDSVLRIKVGAQVMFIKNDTSGERLYFNGKIGVVTAIEKGSLDVTFTETDETIKVKPETWENVRYALNKAGDKLEEDVLGTFTQFPLRLAWAITIHKSQGLTFDKAVIDAGSSFAPGQVYVALSRCRSMDGLVLKSEITGRSIQLDYRVVEFCSVKPGKAQLQDRLWIEKQLYSKTRLLKVYNFEESLKAFEEWYNDLKETDTALTRQVAEGVAEMVAVLKQVEEVAFRFRMEIQRIFPRNFEDEAQVNLLSQRVSSAADYFAGEMFKGWLAPLTSLTNELAVKSKAKKHFERAATLLERAWTVLNNVYEVQLNGELLYKGDRRVHRVEAVKVADKAAKKQKGESVRITFDLYREGKSLDEIAEMRGMTLGTVESHLGILVAEGSINIEELMDMQTVEMIEKVIDTVDEPSLSAVKARLGDEYSYGMIRWVVKAREFATAK